MRGVRKAREAAGKLAALAQSDHPGFERLRITKKQRRKVGQALELVTDVLAVFDEGASPEPPKGAA
jgi:hypothetical protein